MGLLAASGMVCVDEVGGVGFRFDCRCDGGLYWLEFGERVADVAFPQMLAGQSFLIRLRLLFAAAVGV